MKQGQLSFELPEFYVPAVTTRQPDGSMLVRAGKPVPVGDCLGTREAAKLLGLSQRHIETMCLEGALASAHKVGMGERARWRIARAEVWARKLTRD